MGTPDGLLLYCGLCIFIVVVFCCCFHVIELIKLGYLRKLTSPHRYSLSGISNTELLDNDSRSSTRRNTVITSSEETPATSSGASEGGNFSIITVFTYSPASLQTQDTPAQQKRFDNIDLAARRQYLHEALTRKLSPSTAVRVTETNPQVNSTGMALERESGDGNLDQDETALTNERYYDNVNSKSLMDKPPNYDALYPKMAQD